MQYWLAQLQLKEFTRNHDRDGVREVRVASELEIGQQVPSTLIECSSTRTLASTVLL